MSFIENNLLYISTVHRFQQRRKRMYILRLPSSNENNKIMPQNIIFSLFIVTKSASIYIQMKDTTIVLYAPGWNGAFACLISVILEGNIRNLNYHNSLGGRGISGKEASRILEPSSFFLCPFHWVQAIFRIS